MYFSITKIKSPSFKFLNMGTFSNALARWNLNISESISNSCHLSKNYLTTHNTSVRSLKKKIKICFMSFPMTVCWSVFRLLVCRWPSNCQETDEGKKCLASNPEMKGEAKAPSAEAAVCVSMHCSLPEQSWLSLRSARIEGIGTLRSPALNFLPLEFPRSASCYNFLLTSVALPPSKQRTA